jgi:methylenetetrahydrofolate--tRNA-(uracil-5-)-methyltransferase
MARVVRIVGGGLAGAEAAWQLARRGIEVELYEMRPRRMTEAHATAHLAELVCSNSLKSDSLRTAAGLLKEEMRRLGSLILSLAEAHRVPAGTALAVDRERFAEAVSAAIAAMPRVRVRREEVTEIPEGCAILATGPLTSARFSEALARLLGGAHLYFYDAISPIVAAESIDAAVAFRASRYGHGEDYLNLPLSREEYDRLVDEILAAEKVPLHGFERHLVFEGCLPIEEMARRGRETLAFGPLRPSGLVDPRTGRRPYAVVQLRQEDREGRLYNMVGFQTKMTYPEQRRVFSLIPGLERAEFVRLGSLHRNTFIDSPRHLKPTLQWRGDDRLFFAGQITGVEGYVESAAAGLVAGLNAARLLSGRDPLVPPPTTAIGSLLAYITDPCRRDFQPINANFGILPPLGTGARGVEKRELLARRALADLDVWRRALGESEEAARARG